MGEDRQREAGREVRTGARRELLERIELAATWDDLLLPEAERERLRAIAEALRVARGQGASAAPGSRARVALVGNDPKLRTTAAAALAAAMGLPLYRIDLAALTGKYVGETEKQLGQWFATADANGVVLLFDEADDLFGKGGDRGASSERDPRLSAVAKRIKTLPGCVVLGVSPRAAQACAHRCTHVIPLDG